MDPPYQADVESNVFAALKMQQNVTEDTKIIVEAELSKNFEFLNELGFEVIKEKKYKTNKHVFCRKVN